MATEVDDIVSELEEASKTKLTDPVTGADLEHADPDSDTGPEEVSDGRSNWSDERKRKHSEKLKAAWQRRRENGTDKRGSGGSRRKPTKALIESISSQIGQAAAFVGGIWGLRDPYCGQVLIRRSDDLGRVYGQALANNKRVATFFDGMAKGGRYGELILVTLSVALPIMAHHDLLPRQLVTNVMRMVDPDFIPPPDEVAHQHAGLTAVDPIDNPDPMRPNGSVRPLG